MYQAQRLAEVARYGQARPGLGSLAAGRGWDPWAKSAAAKELIPAEGQVVERGAGVDVLGIARMRHDVAVLDPRTGRTALDAVAEEQAPLLRRAMAFDPDEVADQAEQVDTPEGPLRIVNKVCSVTARLLTPSERPMDEDDESEYEEQKAGAPRVSRLGRVGVAGLDFGDAANEEDDDGDGEEDSMTTDDEAVKEKTKNNKNKGRRKKKKKKPMPSILSLRYIQRRWLPLGYKKNKVGTAVSIRFAPPLTSTHMAFSSDRILCMGANNRRNDRAGLVYATLPYLFRPLSDLTLKPRRYGCVRRVSQNIVARQSMPRGRKMCLILFRSRLSKDETRKAPKRFKNIIVEHDPLRTTFLFYRDNKICVGASSYENMARAYAYFRPLVNDCMNTPENEASEQRMIEAGAVDENVMGVLLNYKVRDDGRIEAVYKGDKVAKAKATRKQKRRQ
jgi:TATA-box binding protein (TBP) (component of TFIID and TFIIIB)